MADVCSVCGAAFACGAADKDTPCWCTKMPHIEPSKELGSCLCPKCLTQRIEESRATADAPTLR